MPRLSVFHRKLLSVLALLFIALAPLGAWTLFDDFEYRNWYDPNWAEWFRLGTAVYGNYQGRNCVKQTGPTDKGAQSLITKFFAGEDWSNVDLVKVDIYAETGVTNTQVKLEIFNQSDTPCVVTAAPQTMSTVNSWVTYTWDYTVPASPPVAKLHLIFDNLNANAATFYVDNLRLVLNDGTTHYWDSFDSGRVWGVSGSTAVWSGLPEQVSHNASTSTTNGGAGLLWWNYTGPDHAQLMPSNVNEDWRARNVLRADVRCSTTTIPIAFYFWYGGWGEESTPRYVTQADTWQTLYWDLPVGTTYNNVLGVNPRVKPDALRPSGTFYIDNICTGQTRVTVVKSTDVASARPGSEITCTLTYGNAGTDDVTNLYIYDVVPFNTVLSQQPGTGSADSVEYYVGSSWTSTYNASAAKVRWRDAVVAAGESGRTVSYKVKPK